MAKRHEYEPPQSFIVGTCREMCPLSEVELRVTHKMVHRLELGAGGKLRLVKSFSRSAAGSQVKTRPEELRPPSVCLKTADYLVNSIFVARCSDIGVYDFVFDRLRAVRQDLVVQQGDFRVSKDPLVIQVLELCVKFHLIAGYLLSEVADFDSRTNFAHTLESLKTLLVLLRLTDPGFESRCSVDMAAVYILLNLGSQEALRWSLDLPLTVRRHPLISTSLTMSLLSLQQNFVGIFKRARELPALQLLAFHWNLSHLYSNILAVMSTAYDGGVCQFPIEHFCCLFSINDPAYCHELCDTHGIETTESSIKFVKTNFTSAKVPSRRWPLIEEKLSSEDDLIAFFSSLHL